MVCPVSALTAVSHGLYNMTCFSLSDISNPPVHVPDNDLYVFCTVPLLLSDCSLYASKDTFSKWCHVDSVLVHVLLMFIQFVIGNQQRESFRP